MLEESSIRLTGSATLREPRNASLKVERHPGMDDRALLAGHPGLMGGMGGVFNGMAVHPQQYLAVRQEKAFTLL